MNNFNSINNHKLIFFIILVFSIILRIITIDKFATWGDEKLSISEANGLINYSFQPNTIFTKRSLNVHNNLTNVILSNLQGDGGNGILYTICLHYWINMFGNNDLNVRFLSLILGVILVVLVYFLSFEMFEHKKMSLLIMLLTSIHPLLITFSQEARSYALALIFSSSSSFMLLKYLSEKKNDLHILFYMLFVSFAILSHYSTIYIFVAHLLILFFLFKINLKQWLKLVGFSFIPLIILLLWLFSYGLEGLKVIASRNQNYIELSSIDPSNPFYMKTTLYSILAGWSQNFLTFAGNTFMNAGLRIRVIFPLLIIPFLLIFLGLKKIKINEVIYIKMIIILSISSLVYATILSFISGHIISFQQLYSIFSIPYFIILLGLSIFRIYTSKPGKIKNVLNLMIFLQIAIMMACTTTIYFGFDSHTKEINNYEVSAHQIKEIYSAKKNEFIIVYKEKYTAMEINKYLNDELSYVPQIIDTSNSNPSLYLFLPNNQQRIVILE